MNMFFDENIGRGVPLALRNVGFRNVRYLRETFRKRIRRGERIYDRDWIPMVGQQGWLAITEDLAILDNEDERALLLEHNVGIVFLKAANLPASDVLAFMLRRMKWLEAIDQQPRPFAYVTGLRGRATLDPRVAAP